MPIKFAESNNLRIVFLVVGIALILSSIVLMQLFFSTQRVEVGGAEAKPIYLTVQDLYSGEPVPNATIYVFSPENETLDTTTTNASGIAITNDNFTIGDRLIILVKHPEYFDTTYSLRIEHKTNDSYYRFSVPALKKPSILRVLAYYYEEDAEVFDANKTYAYNVSMQTKNITVQVGENETANKTIAYIEKEVSLYFAVFMDYPLQRYTHFDDTLEHYIYLNITPIPPANSSAEVSAMCSDGYIISRNSSAIFAKEISGKTPFVPFELTLSAQNVSENETFTFSISAFIMFSAKEYDTFDGVIVWETQYKLEIVLTAVQPQ